MAAAAALLLADTLYSLPYPVSAAGLVPITIPRAAAGPSVHATQPRVGGGTAAATHPCPGRHASRRRRSSRLGSALADPDRRRIWADAPANPCDDGPHGYQWVGSPYVLGSDDQSLDLLAVRRIVMHAEDLTSPSTFERDGLTWSSPPLNIALGRADCHRCNARHLSLPLPAGIEVAEIAMVGHLRCSEDLPAGTEVVRVELRGTGSPLYRTALTVGTEIADRALAETAVAARAKHGPAVVFDDPATTPNEYLVRIRPPAPVRADQLVLDVNPISGWVVVNSRDNRERCRPFGSAVTIGFVSPRFEPVDRGRPV